MAVGTALNDLEMFTVADFGVMVERESLANLNQLKRMNSI
jgi:hydroxymethylpyrimidine pyrophosphatase-like HAD family hydrolase